jgi:hypothetical protein
MQSLRSGGESRAAETSNGWSEPQKELVRAQLAKVLECTQFRSSKRCSQFLRFVVEHAVENRIACLKERTLGIEVFERHTDYDTNQDPIVRSTAGEVRKRLAQYYLEPGHEEELRISLPTGSYVPEIHAPPEKGHYTARPAPPRRIFPRKAWFAVAGAALLAAIAYGSFARRQSDLDGFWDPVATAPGPVLICVGQPRTYGFQARKQGRIESWLERRRENEPPPPELAAIPFEDIVPIWDRYIGLSDARAYERTARILFKRGKEVQLRGDRSVTLSELRGKPIVLIGAFNNDWTLSLAGELRFYFQTDPSHDSELVRDRQNPQKDDWRVVHAWPDRKIPADYAIVTRVRNPTTEQTVVIAAGITMFGTWAAAELLTDEGYFQQAIRGAPRDWRRKNMQIVVAVKVMSGTSGPPQAVDKYFW